jgi:hypothetical protein
MKQLKLYKFSVQSSTNTERRREQDWQSYSVVTGVEVDGLGNQAEGARAALVNGAEGASGRQWRPQGWDHLSAAPAPCQPAVRRRHLFSPESPRLPPPTTTTRWWNPSAAGARARWAVGSGKGGIGRWVGRRPTTGWRRTMKAQDWALAGRRIEGGRQRVNDSVKRQIRITNRRNRLRSVWTVTCRDQATDVRDAASRRQVEAKR